MLFIDKIIKDKIGRREKFKLTRKNNSTKGRRYRFLKSSYLIYVNLFYYVTNTQLGWYSGLKINKLITHCFFFIIKKQKKCFMPILQFFHFLKKWKNLKERLKLKQVTSKRKTKKKFNILNIKKHKFKIFQIKTTLFFHFYPLLKFKRCNKKEKVEKMLKSHYQKFKLFKKGA
jgi:hypothetical protein